MWIQANLHVQGFVVCIVGKMAQDVGMAWKYCGVIPILFGRLLRVPSLHTLVFGKKTFFVTLALHTCTHPYMEIPIILEYSKTLQNNIINLFQWNRSQYWKVRHFTHFNYFLATLVVAYPVLHPDFCLEVERVCYHAICISISFTCYECMLHNRYFLEGKFPWSQQYENFP